ncbi:bile acid:sodium symporter family protein [Kibdelosporangium philippinense]|uniref:Bile acid:sodium symporter family protein n=1 Tax=Kibdelosporangium philippinense TaxID=211113 RepID=A0ABS8Z356_9PSEU|nr:bile acid:sodium symporter family protein [Kibdelosporangium philippinense]MCE7001344.1 bile acid:sodium symporter family protein [Kibdelosporangium philippinense]
MTSSSVVTTVFLPIALGVIMLGLGMSLTVQDFKRVAEVPKATIVALVCQVLLLPAICLGLVLLFDLSPTLAVGMMLLAASPGGTTANLFSHLAGGDVALNITLTAINAVIAVVTLPIVVNLSLSGFMDGGELGLQFDKMLQVFAIVLVPVAIGMLVRRRFTAFADRMLRPLKIAAVVFMVATIAVAVFQERANIGGYLQDVGAISLVFCVISLSVGYAIPRLLKVNRRQSIASSMEIGIHNSTLAITIALSPALLNNTQMAIPAAVYGVVMFIPAGVFAYWVSRRPAQAEVTTT